MDLNYLRIFLLFVFISNFCTAQSNIDIKNLRSKFAKIDNRIKFQSELNEFINTSLSKPIIKENFKSFRHALSDASLYFIKNNNVADFLKRIFNSYKTINNKLVFRSIQTAYNLYPKLFINEIKIILNETVDVSVFSAASIYLLDTLGQKIIQNDLHSRFTDITTDAALIMLDYYLNDNKENRPPIEDLLLNQFQNNKTIVYSFQRKDRIYPGLTIIKSPEGKFIRNEDGTIFNIPHLALSASNFPGFLANGNTPQGIFSIQKYYYSPTEEIGPSPILLSRIPYEIDAEKFYHNEIIAEKWNIEDYKNLLPNSWKDYLPIYESFYAGKLGRRVIVAHGSADDPIFYKDKPYAPLTPTKGCLAAKELWDSKGRLIESDQVKLMNAFFSTEQLYGFLVVVEIDDKKEPVKIEELIPLINKSELTLVNDKY